MKKIDIMDEICSSDFEECKKLAFMLSKIETIYSTIGSQILNECKNEQTVESIFEMWKWFECIPLEYKVPILHAIEGVTNRLHNNYEAGSTIEFKQLDMMHMLLDDVKTEFSALKTSQYEREEMREAGEEAHRHLTNRIDFVFKALLDNCYSDYPEIAEQAVEGIGSKELESDMLWHHRYRTRRKKQKQIE